MTKFVEQKTSHDCVIAAIAMATGKSYEEVMKIALREDEPDKEPYYVAGKGTWGTTSILQKLGYTSRSYQQFDGDMASYNAENGPIKSSHYKGLIWGRKALIAVPSLNLEDGTHKIYYDGHQLHDPNPVTRKRYEFFEDIKEIRSFIIFREKL